MVFGVKSFQQKVLENKGRTRDRDVREARQQSTDALVRAIETGTILQARLDKMARLAVRMAAAEGPRRTSAQLAIREFVHELYGPSGPPIEPGTKPKDDTEWIRF